MTDPPDDVPAAQDFPTARVQPSRWTFPVIWVVPILAALVAGYLVYGRLQEFGPTITITFRDGNGVKPGQTEIRYRGVPIGEVTAIELTEDQERVVVKARLRRSASSIARDGSLFWIVRPEVGFGTIRGLSTVITGPYIQAFPGTGTSKTAFVGLERASLTLGQRGLNITLATDQLESVRPGAAVHYRGVEVGSVTATELSGDATAAHIQVFINQRYARLVRIGSRFWTVSGVDVNISLFRGLQINMESLRSLVAGGIAFATPAAESPPAKDGTIFVLHDKPQKEWLEWRPKIPMPSAN